MTGIQDGTRSGICKQVGDTFWPRGGGIILALTGETLWPPWGELFWPLTPSSIGGRWPSEKWHCWTHPKKPITMHHPRMLSPEAVDKILVLRRAYVLGPRRIPWYLESYHVIKVSFESIYRAHVRHGISWLPRCIGRRAVHTDRYAMNSAITMFRQTRRL